MEPQSTPNTQIGACQDRLDALSKQIIGCALTVMRTLGAGFLEKVDENALVHKPRRAGLAVAQHHRMVVRYNDAVVGDYTVDLLVENIVLVELKVAGAIDDIHRAQCLNYLKTTGPRLCLLLNFDRLRLEIKRMVRNFWGNIAAFACSACFAVPSSWDRCASRLEEPVASVEGINSNWHATVDGRYRIKERRASTGMSADMLVLLASYVIFY